MNLSEDLSSLLSFNSALATALTNKVSNRKGEKESRTAVMRSEACLD